MRRLMIAGLLLIAAVAALSATGTETEKGGARMIVYKQETEGTPLDRVPENTETATFALG